MTIKGLLSLAQLVCFGILIYLHIKKIFGKVQNKDNGIDKSGNKIIEAETEEKEE